LSHLDFHTDSLGYWQNILQDSISNGLTSLERKASKFIEANQFQKAENLYEIIAARYENSARIQQKISSLDSLKEIRYEDALVNAENFQSKGYYEKALESLELAEVIFPDDLRWDRKKKELQTKITNAEEAAVKANENKWKEEDERWEKQQEKWRQVEEQKRKLKAQRKSNESASEVNRNIFLKKSVKQVCYNPGVRRSPDDMVIERIEFGGTMTKIKIRASEPLSEGATIWPPGHIDAFRLEKSKGRTLAKLISVEGIGSNKLGKSFETPIQSFTLVFEKIPSETSRVNLIEGSGGGKRI